MMRLVIDGRETGVMVKKAERLLERAAGLIPQKKPVIDECMVFERCSSIHTFFMRFSIDVVFCGADGTVISVVRGLKPWRFAFDFKASFAVELAGGLAEGLGIREGSVIKFE